MKCIDAENLQDGLYNIKNGKIYKYKAKGGTVRTYELRNIVTCGECIFADEDAKAEMCRCRNVSFPMWNKADDFCSYGERDSGKPNNSNERSE